MASAKRASTKRTRTRRVVDRFNAVTHADVTDLQLLPRRFDLLVSKVDDLVTMLKDKVVPKLDHIVAELSDLSTRVSDLETFRHKTDDRISVIEAKIGMKVA